MLCVISFQQDCSLGENDLPAHLKEKAAEKTKRPADGSPENVPSRKRAAFGDITNVRKVSHVLERILQDIPFCTSLEATIKIFYFWFLGDF